MRRRVPSIRDIQSNGWVMVRGPESEALNIVVPVDNAGDTTFVADYVISPDMLLDFATVWNCPHRRMIDLARLMRSSQVREKCRGKLFGVAYAVTDTIFSRRRSFLTFSTVRRTSYLSICGCACYYSDSGYVW